MQQMTARQEWARWWATPVAGVLGVTGGSMFGYSISAFMEPITKEFGWTRTEYFSVVTLQMMSALILVPLVGRMVDRFGSRKLAIFGSFTHMACISALALANGSVAQWWALGVLVILGGVFVTQPVWVTPVTRHFEASRGLAMATVMSGNGVATTIWPLLATLFIGWLGWRLALPGLILAWGVVTIPLVIAGFDRSRPNSVHPLPAEADEPAAPPATIPPVMPLLLSGRFLLLLLSGALFSGPVYGLSIHLLPMMREQGLTPGYAASVAALAGISAIVGRLCTGYLLDRFSTRIIAVTVFLFPILAALLIPLTSGAAVFGVCAAILLGLAAGAEIDVVAYITSRQFDRSVFGTLFAVIIGVFGAIASLGPLSASMVFDRFGSYLLFQRGIIPFFFVGAAMIWIVASHREVDPAPGH